jgi:hypothetical protein
LLVLQVFDVQIYESMEDQHLMLGARVLLVSECSQAGSECAKASPLLPELQLPHLHRNYEE